MRGLRSGSTAPKSEREIQTEILLTFGALPWLRIWRMNTGKAYGFSLVQAAKNLLVKGNFQAGLEALRRMPLTTYGTPGAADIQGIIMHSAMGDHGVKTIGRFIAIEVKQPGNTQSNEQERWQGMVESMGGLYLVARDVADVHERLYAEGYFR